MHVIDGVLYGADAIVARFVNEQCGGGFEIGRIDRALGVLGANGLVGGVAFSNYIIDKDITITVASTEYRACGHPRVIARCLAYPFRTLQLPRVTAEIEPDNARSLRNAERLGFVQEGVKRGTGVILLGLLPEDFIFRDLMPDEKPIDPRAAAAA